MEFTTDLPQLKIEKRSAITLGKFDGLHRGHQLLITQVLQKKKEGCAAAIFTFDAPPNRLLNGQRSGTILTNQERRDLAEQFQIDWMVQCPFTKEVACMEPEDFIKDVLVEKMNVAWIVVGEDFRFGYQRKGDIELLSKLEEKYGYRVMVFSKEQYQGRDISSSYIRETLSAGEMELTETLLGYPFFLVGNVVYGKQFGRQMGIPTANLLPDEKKLLPPNGVYASHILLEGAWYNGMTNIGVRPTVEHTNQKNVETYLFDYQGDLYGKELTIQLLHYERPECRFESAELLKRQLDLDCITTKKWLCANSVK